MPHDKNKNSATPDRQALAQLKMAVSLAATLRICLHAFATQEANAVDAFHLWQVCELLEKELTSCEETMDATAL